jgi:type IV pilus assembly protein PilW
MGAVFVYQQSRSSYQVNEQVARLQENGRYALALMGPDIQLAGNYGGSNQGEHVKWIPDDRFAAEIKPTDLPITGPGAIHDCGNNFALYLIVPVQGTNNSYGLGCAPGGQAGVAVATADTLTIRRTESTPRASASAAFIQVYTNKLVKQDQRAFLSNIAPGPINEYNQIYNLTFRSYYIGTNSSTRVGMPTLWRKVLSTDTFAPTVIDEEIMPGVEDFQVEFGVDTGDYNADGALDNDQEPPIGVADDANGRITRWVRPNAPELAPWPAGRQWQVVAVRVWLRLRSDMPEPNFTDTETYDYAGVVFTPAGAERSFRRLVVSRTFYLRNARIF